MTLFGMPRLTDIVCPHACVYCSLHFAELDQTDWANLTKDERCRLLLGHARHHLNR